MAAADTGGEFLDSLATSLQCSICLEFYTNPTSLPCGHVFCKDTCLFDLYKKGQGKVTCPLCRFESYIDNFEALQVIYDLNTTIMTIQKETQRKSSNQAPAGAGDASAASVDKCKEHKDNAVLWCTKCSEKVCVNCLTGTHAGHAFEHFSVHMHSEFLERFQKVNFSSLLVYRGNALTELKKTRAKLDVLRDNLERMEDDYSQDLERLKALNKQMSILTTASEGPDKYSQNEQLVAEFMAATEKDLPCSKSEINRLTQHTEAIAKFLKSQQSFKLPVNKGSETVSQNKAEAQPEKEGDSKSEAKSGKPKNPPSAAQNQRSRHNSGGSDCSGVSAGGGAKPKSARNRSQPQKQNVRPPGPNVANQRFVRPGTPVGPRGVPLQPGFRPPPLIDPTTGLLLNRPPMMPGFRAPPPFSGPRPAAPGSHIDPSQCSTELVLEIPNVSDAPPKNIHNKVEFDKQCQLMYMVTYNRCLNVYFSRNPLGGDFYLQCQCPGVFTDIAMLPSSHVLGVQHEAGAKAQKKVLPKIQISGSTSKVVDYLPSDSFKQTSTWKVASQDWKILVYVEQEHAVHVFYDTMYSYHVVTGSLLGRVNDLFTHAPHILASCWDSKEVAICGEVQKKELKVVRKITNVNFLKFALMGDHIVTTSLQNHSQFVFTHIANHSRTTLDSSVKLLPLAALTNNSIIAQDTSNRNKFFKVTFKAFSP